MTEVVLASENAVCPWCDGVFPVFEDMMTEHVLEEHVSTVRPPDLSVVRDAITSDITRTLIEGGVFDGIEGGTVEALVDVAVAHVRRQVAQQFPQDSHTVTYRVGFEEEADTSMLRLDTAFIAAVTLLTQWVEEGESDPAGGILTLTLTPDLT